MAAELSRYRTCAIAIPDSEKTSSFSNEHIVGAIGGTPASSTVLPWSLKLNQLWESGAGGPRNSNRKSIRSSSNGDDNLPPCSPKPLQPTGVYRFPYANLTFQRAAVGTLRISFDPHLGSWSNVGAVNQTIPSSQVTMNLGWVTDTTTVSDDDRGSILHEFRQALGLLHDSSRSSLHQSPARNGTITLDEDAVYAYYMTTQNWDKATVLHAGGNEHPAHRRPAELHAFGHGQGVHSHQLPASHSPASAPNWTLEYALKVSGVDAANTQDIMNAMAKNDVIKIRAIFTAFQIAARVTAAPPPVSSTDGTNGTGTSSENGANSSGNLFMAPANGANTGGSGASGSSGSTNGTDSPSMILMPAETWCETPDPITQTSSDASNGELRGVASVDLMWMPHYTLDLRSEPTEYRKQFVRDVLARYMAHTSLVFREMYIQKRDFNDESERQRRIIHIASGRSTRVPGGVRLGWSCIRKEAIDSAFTSKQENSGPPWCKVWLGGHPLHDDAARWKYGHSGETIVPHFASQLIPRVQFDPDSVMLYRNLPYLVDPSKKSKLNIIPSPTDFDFLRVHRRGQKVLLENTLNALGTNGSEVDKEVVGYLRLMIQVNFQKNPRLSDSKPKDPSLSLSQPLMDVGGPAAPATVSSASVPGFLMELVNTLNSFSWCLKDCLLESNRAASTDGSTKQVSFFPDDGKLDQINLGRLKGHLVLGQYPASPPVKSRGSPSDPGGEGGDGTSDPGDGSASDPGGGGGGGVSNPRGRGGGGTTTFALIFSADLFGRAGLVYERDGGWSCWELAGGCGGGNGWGNKVGNGWGSAGGGGAMETCA
ncbi:hypothetical protein B0H14DRAFT_2580176 [Mycena olivaceomarginata]|nr:hypothetical protein B0H14DRAFT_2580176 [Mycena olivaceomarginata]